MHRAILAALLWISAGVAHATSYSGSITYFSRLHFSSVAWSKDVAGVYAHVGVHTTSPWMTAGTSVWGDVHHVRLEKGDTGFTSKVELHGPRSSHGDNSFAVDVQYWVYFTDGTQMITDPVVIRPSRWESYTDGSPESEEAFFRLQREFADDEDIDATEIVAHESGHVG